MCSCLGTSRSSTPTWTPSTPRSSSATILASAGARSSWAGAWCWRPATRPRRAACGRRWAARRPGGRVRGRWSSLRGWPPTARPARPCSRCSRRPRRWWRASRSTRRSWTCAGWSGSRARRSRSPAGCGATSASGWGCPSRWVWPAPSSWPRWPAGWPSPTGCWWCRPGASWASCIRCRWSGCGGSGRSPPRSCANADWRPSARWRGWPRRRSSRCWAGRSAGTFTPSPTTAIPAECARDAAGARWAPSGRSAGHGGPGTPWTRSSSAWSTAWPAGCATPGGPAARSCCGCASTTSRGPPAPTRWLRRRRRPTRSWPRPGT